MPPTSNAMDVTSKDQPQNIVFVQPTLALRGGNVIVKEYCKILRSCGKQVEIIGYLDHPYPSLFEDENQTKLTFLFGNNSLAKKISIGLFLFPEIFRLASALSKKRGYMPVTTYTPMALILTLLWLFGYCDKPKLIVHDSLEMRWIGRVSYKLILPFLIKILGDSCLAIVDEGLCQDIGFKRKKPQLKPIRNGISDQFFAVSSGTIVNDRVGIFVGAPKAPKGWDALTRECKILETDIPNVRIQCFLSSAPDMWNGQNFPNLAISAIGAGHSEIARAMSHLSFAISASRADSFGLPIVEAMAAQLIPIASTTKGSQMHASQGAHIRFFDLQKPGDLVRALREVFDLSAEQRTAIIKTNRAYAERYMWKNSKDPLCAFLTKPEQNMIAPPYARNPCLQK